MHDMLGIFPGKTAKFVKNFMQGKDSVQAAVKAYVDEVKAKRSHLSNIRCRIK